MPNVTISALPDAIIPLDSPNTFFEVQTLESGVTVSRKVTADNIVITASGMIAGTGIVDPSTALPYDYDAELTFENANALETARLGWNGSSVFEIQNQAFGASIQIRGKSNAGGDIIGMVFNPNSEVLGLNDQAILIDRNGEIDFEYDVAGGNTGNLMILRQLDLQIIDQSSSTSGRLVFSQGSFIVTERGHVGLDTDGFFRMFAALTAGVALGVRTSGFDWDVLDTNVPAGTMSLNALTAGNVQTVNLTTKGTGITLGGILANDPATPGLTQDVSITLQNATPANVGLVGYVGSDFRIEVNQRGANLLLRVTDDAGVIISALNADPNVNTQLGHGPSNAFVARTITPAAGGLEIDNQATGGGFERVLTTVDLGLSFPIAALDNDQIQWGTSNDVQQFFDGTDLLFTAVAGVDFRFSSASTALLELVGTGLNLDATLGTRADSGGVAWYWDESVTTGKIRQTSAAGVLEDDWITMVINGAVAVFFNGANVAQTMAAASGGLQVNNTLTGAGFERVLTTADISGSPFVDVIITEANVIDLVDTNVALNIGAVDPTADVHIELGLFSNGGGIQAKATDTTVIDLFINPLGETTWIGPPASAAVAGGVNLRHANGAGSGGNIIETTISGIILEGRTGSNTILDFHQVSGNLALRMVWNGANFQFDGFVDSMEFNFNARDAGSVNRQLLHMDPDTDIEIYHPPSAAIVIETHTPATGGAFVNNTLTGAGLERVLTTGDLGGTASALVGEILTAGNVTLTGTTLTNIVSAAVVANTDYLLMAQIQIISPTADDMRFTFTEPAGLVLNGTATNTGDNDIRPIAEDVIQSFSTLGVSTDTITMTAVVRVAGTAGTLTLQASKLADTGADATVFDDETYLWLIPLP